MTTNQLADRQIRNKILSMIIPITAENILQMTAGVVSMAMIGRIDALAVGQLESAISYLELYGQFLKVYQQGLLYLLLKAMERITLKN